MASPTVFSISGRVIEGDRPVKNVVVMIKNKDNLRPVNFKVTRRGINDVSYDYLRDGKEAEKRYFNNLLIVPFFAFECSFILTGGILFSSFYFVLSIINFLINFVVFNNN